jgi:two-component SAPR family response regulator
MIRVLCVNSNIKLLTKMESVVKEILPSSDVNKEEKISLNDVKKLKPHIMLLSSELENFKIVKQMNDEEIKSIVIFVGDEKVEAYDAIKAHARGFILSPLTKDNLKEELISLNLFEKNKRIEVKTFGNFDILLDGKSLKFTRSKSKELIAYLIDKKGTSVSSSELIVNLWEDHDIDRTTRSMLHNLITDIRQVLTKYDILDIIEIDRNAYRIIEDKISCDYYDLLKGKKSAINKFTGEYMAAYGWAVFTSSNLSEMFERY